MSAATHSTPLAVKACALGFDGSRVMARILNSPAVLGSLRMDLITEPPWLPVAPKTTRIFFAAMIEILLLSLRQKGLLIHLYISELWGKGIVAGF